LQASEQAIGPVLDAAAARDLPLEPVSYDEPGFRFAMNQDAMATEKLAEGIRAFAADADKLDRLVEGVRA
jgi:transaldolase